MTMDFLAETSAVASMADLARLLRGLRERQAHRGGATALTYRQIAELTGMSRGAIGAYLTGEWLPPADRFTQLVKLLGADPDEHTALAEARERLAAEAGAQSDLTARAVVVPGALPGRVAAFTGRDEQLARLDSLVGVERRSTRFCTITGMPGVGKTALAVSWAHRVAASFPDGQLYVDLHSYSPRARLSTMEALGVLLAGLGVEIDALPDLRSRSLRYQSLLRGRNVLVLLDNVGSADRLRPLLPPPPCVAVMTSRNESTDLDGLNTADRMALDVLPQREALTLLRSLVGERVDREPGATQALSERCGRLPLALRVAAEHVAARPQSALVDLVAELDEVANPLEAFEVPGDTRADLRSVFSWSLRGLPQPAAQLFLVLGLLPGVDIDRHAVVALAGASAAEADELILALTSAHLLQAPDAGRYSMHDLLRAYAAERADAEIPTLDRRATIGRLLAHYLRAATAAVDLLFPAYGQIRPNVAAADVRPLSGLEFVDAGAGAAWLAAERANLVRACAYAAANGWPREAIALALVLGRYLEETHYDDALAVHTAAAAAVANLGSDAGPAERAGVQHGLGVANLRLGRLDPAAEQFRAAFEENVRAGNRTGAARNLVMLGTVLDGLGRNREAIEPMRRAVEIARASGVRAEEAMALGWLAAAYGRVEDFATAEDLFAQAYRVAEGEAWVQVQVRGGWAAALEGLGRYDEALAHAEQSVAENRAFGVVAFRLRTQATLGSVLRRMGRLDDALEHLIDALAECRERDNPQPTAAVLNALGETWYALGDQEQALARHTEALALAQQSVDGSEHTRALVGLGDAHAAAGDTRPARQYWQQARARYAAAGLPAADRIQACLDTLDG